MSKIKAVGLLYLSLQMFGKMKLSGKVYLSACFFLLFVPILCISVHVQATLCHSQMNRIIIQKNPKKKPIFIGCLALWKGWRNNNQFDGYWCSIEICWLKIKQLSLNLMLLQSGCEWFDGWILLIADWLIELEECRRLIICMVSL